MHRCLLDIRIRSATCHVAVQSFFHQPLRSIRFCFLSMHICEDALSHVRSCLLVQLDALSFPFASFGYAETQGCEAQGRKVRLGSTQEALRGRDPSRQDVVRRGWHGPFRDCRAAASGQVLHDPSPRNAEGWRTNSRTYQLSVGTMSHHDSPKGLPRNLGCRAIIRDFVL